MIAFAVLVGIIFIVAVFVLALAIFALADALAHQARDDRAMLRMAATDADHARQLARAQARQAAGRLG